ncbi:MAG: hypothetical protein OEV28_06190 [Nitrospirota bacterium]|nr:hypothetical protein [Nitrospirota bacterium]
MKSAKKIVARFSGVTRAVAGIFLAVLLLNGCGGGKPSEVPEAALDRYIKAAQSGDFKTLYEMDYLPQRQIVLIYRAGEEGRQAKLDENFKKSRELYDEATTLVGFSSAWAEKFLFIPQMKYTIGGSETRKLGDNPTSKYREREAAAVEVAVEYADAATAPKDAQGSIKKVTYEVKLMPLADIVKGLKTSLDEKAWIVRSIDVKSGTLEYW